MEKGRRWVLVLSVAILLVLVGILFFYFALFKPSYSKESSGVVLQNPAANLSLEEAEQKFDGSFVAYVLYSIKAYDLHNPPLSNEDPKIEFMVDSDVYSAVVQNGVIKVEKKSIDNPDAIIKTSKEEAVKMVQSKNYVQESFANGKSEIELKAGKATLFGKGYLNLYNELTGNSVTGDVIRIYTS